jgi:intracellular septation protein
MTESSPPATAASPGFRMLIDFGPLAIFFLVNSFAPGPALAKMLAATAAFMAAIFVAMGLSWWKTRHISPMLWISGGFVLIFGTLTLWFHNGTFIKMKPTIVYSLFAVVLFYGVIARKPLLQALLGTAYPGLSERGWKLLTINWAVFFVFMAVLNEIVWRWSAPGPQDDLSFWAGFKLWGAIPLTLLFAMGNIPLLLRHGLKTDADIVEKALPPEQ